jgi:hypothetical protein
MSLRARQWTKSFGLMAWATCCFLFAFGANAHSQTESNLPSTAQASPTQTLGLAQRVDAILAKDPEWLLGERLSDGLLLRRLSLDLRNVVPTPEELAAFLGDTSEDRWSRWIERFQQDPLASERLVDWYDKSLMQRRPFQHVDRPSWLRLLRTVVDQRKPLDELIRSLVTSVWWNPSQRAEQRFFLDRGGDPHAIARDLGRVLFGRDMQCAQCHDHPQIDDYFQIDYHGLFAFVSASSIVEGTTKDEQGVEKKIPLYIERASGDAPFESVFDKGVKFRSATRVPGQPEQFEPYIAPDVRYLESPKPDALAGIGPAPKASRREALASQLAGTNRAFAENWANRLWALMFGRGIVHPLDMHHSDNPPSNPELLAAVTDALIASKFDVPSVLAELAKSQAYQRGHRFPMDQFVNDQAVLLAPEEVHSAWTTMLEERKVAAKAEHARLIELQDAKSAAMDAARAQWRTIQSERTTLRAELDTAEASFQESHKKSSEAQNALNQASASEAATVNKIALLDDAAQKLEQAKSSPDDPELSPAVAAAKTRLEQLKAALPALQQATATATATRDAAITAREGERSKWQSVVDKLTPVEQRLLDADRLFVQARIEHDAARTDANLQLRLVAQTERIQRWIQLSSDVASKRVQAQQLEQEQTDFATQLASLQQQLEVAQKQLDVFQQSLTQFDQVISSASSNIASIESEMDQLRKTKQAILDSAMLISDPSAFAAATSELDRALDTRSTRLTDAKSNLAGMTQQRIALMADVELGTTMRDQAMKRLQDGAMQRESLDARRNQLLSEISGLEEKCVETRVQIGADRQHQHATAVDRPLSPEQLIASILRSTGILHSYIANELVELNKAGELGPDATEEQKRVRNQLALRGAVDKLQGYFDIFSNLYASGVGQTSDDFFASPDQALYCGQWWGDLLLGGT